VTYGTHHNPASEIMKMCRGLPKRPPIYREHREEEDDEEDGSRGEERDVDLPRSGSCRLV
jgi:hypothetical protein